MRHGWSLKRLHKLILTSTTYRQSAQRELDKDRIDPDNRLYGRGSLRRLEAEAVRDSILAISGRAHDKAFGPPVPVKENEAGQFVLGIDTKDGAGRFTKEIPLSPGEDSRRSVYVQVRRSRPLGVLDTFDAPILEPNCEMRSSSTVTPQALMLMNSEFIVTQASYFAERLRREAGKEPRAQVVLAWRLTFGQEPSENEIEQALTFLAEQTKHFSAARAKPDPPSQALASFCQALFGANAFLYVD